MRRNSAHRLLHHSEHGVESNPKEAAAPPPEALLLTDSGVAVEDLPLKSHPDDLILDFFPRKVRKKMIVFTITLRFIKAVCSPISPSVREIKERRLAFIVPVEKYISLSLLPRRTVGWNASKD